MSREYRHGIPRNPSKAQDARVRDDAVPLGLFSRPRQRHIEPLTDDEDDVGVHKGIKSHIPVRKNLNPYRDNNSPQRRSDIRKIPGKEQQPSREVRPGTSQNSLPEARRAQTPLAERNAHPHHPVNRPPEQAQYRIPPRKTPSSTVTTSSSAPATLTPSAPNMLKSILKTPIVTRPTPSYTPSRTDRTGPTAAAVKKSVSVADSIPSTSRTPANGQKRRMSMDDASGSGGHLAKRRTTLEQLEKRMREEEEEKNRQKKEEQKSITLRKEAAEKKKAEERRLSKLKRNAMQPSTSSISVEEVNQSLADRNRGSNEMHDCQSTTSSELRRQERVKQKLIDKGQRVFRIASDDEEEGERERKKKKEKKPRRSPDVAAEKKRSPPAPERMEEEAATASQNLEEDIVYTVKLSTTSGDSVSDSGSLASTQPDQFARPEDEDPWSAAITEAMTADLFGYIRPEEEKSPVEKPQEEPQPKQQESPKENQPQPEQEAQSNQQQPEHELSPHEDTIADDDSILMDLLIDEDAPPPRAPSPVREVPRPITVKAEPQSRPQTVEETPEEAEQADNVEVTQQGGNDSDSRDEEEVDNDADSGMVIDEDAPPPEAPPPAMHVPLPMRVKQEPSSQVAEVREESEEEEDEAVDVEDSSILAEPPVNSQRLPDKDSDKWSQAEFIKWMEGHVTSAATIQDAEKTAENLSAAPAASTAADAVVNSTGLADIENVQWSEEITPSPTESEKMIEPSASSPAQPLTNEPTANTSASVNDRLDSGATGSSTTERSADEATSSAASSSSRRFPPSPPTATVAPNQQTAGDTARPSTTFSAIVKQELVSRTPLEEILIIDIDSDDDDEEESRLEQADRPHQPQDMDMTLTPSEPAPTPQVPQFMRDLKVEVAQTVDLTVNAPSPPIVLVAIPQPMTSPDSSSSSPGPSTSHNAHEEETPASSKAKRRQRLCRWCLNHSEEVKPGPSHTEICPRQTPEHIQECEPCTLLTEKRTRDRLYKFVHEVRSQSRTPQGQQRRADEALMIKQLKSLTPELKVQYELLREKFPGMSALDQHWSIIKELITLARAEQAQRKLQQVSTAVPSNATVTSSSLAATSSATAPTAMSNQVPRTTAPVNVTHVLKQPTGTVTPPVSPATLSVPSTSTRTIPAPSVATPPTTAVPDHGPQPTTEKRSTASAVVATTSSTTPASNATTAPSSSNATPSTPNSAGAVPRRRTTDTGPAFHLSKGWSLKVKQEPRF